MKMFEHVKRRDDIKTLRAKGSVKKVAYENVGAAPRSSLLCRGGRYFDTVSLPGPVLEFLEK
jgi:hypothetical protein